eukprot:5314911-Amphidinium_carterae.1
MDCCSGHAILIPTDETAVQKPRRLPSLAPLRAPLSLNRCSLSYSFEIVQRIASGVGYFDFIVFIVHAFQDNNTCCSLQHWLHVNTGFTALVLKCRLPMARRSCKRDVGGVFSCLTDSVGHCCDGCVLQEQKGADKPR